MRLVNMDFVPINFIRTLVMTGNSGVTTGMLNFP